jgi:NAD(P)-dependent dehydrogenase (short-subunit alcohol dehydrogenase family)
MTPVVLITGGSRGIGAATARLAAQQGFAVAVNYAADARAADAVVQQIRAGGGSAMAVQADVAHETQVLAMFSAVEAKHGTLTALVNNAGVVDVAARLDEMTVPCWTWRVGADRAPGIRLGWSGQKCAA